MVNFEKVSLRSWLPLLLGLLAVSSLEVNGGKIGVHVTDLRTSGPTRVVALLKLYNVDTVVVYDEDPRDVSRLIDSGIKVILGIPDGQISALQTLHDAVQFLEENLLIHQRDGVIAVAVGRNALSSQSSNDTVATVVVTVRSIHRALRSLRLQRQILLLCPMGTDILTKTHPPSQAEFLPQEPLQEAVRSILDLVLEPGGVFALNAYPYFCCAKLECRVSFCLGDGLFTDGYRDGDRWISSLPDEQMRAIESCLANMGYEGFSVGIFETGWPSSGSEVATTKNQMKYLKNLKRMAEDGVDIFVYNLEDPRGSNALQDGAATWGLVDSSGIAKTFLELN